MTTSQRAGDISAAHFRTVLDTLVSDEDTFALWPVYEAVFGDQPDVATWRDSVWDRHVSRDGFRLARAYLGAELAGFAYGYTGDRGQWWTERAFEVLPAETSAAWLGGHFELVSIGVLPKARGRGVGRALLRLLTAELSAGRRPEVGIRAFRRGCRHPRCQA